MWNGIREAGNDDYERLERTAKDFQKKYFPKEDWDEEQKECYTWFLIDNWSEDPARLRSIFKKRIHRALKDNDADGIAYGLVGYQSE